MALTTAQQVRLRIQDAWRWDEESRVGDGTGSAYKLRQGAPHSNLSAVALSIVSGATLTATGGTVDTGLGLVTFSSVISAQSAWRANYQWAVFSDEEIGFFTAQGGGVLGAAVEAVKVLMFDSLKRASWSSPDGTSYDDTAAMKQLQDLYKMLLDEQRQDPAGGIESWSENQAYWASEYNA